MKWSFASIVLVPRGAWGAPPTAEDRNRAFKWAVDNGFNGIELSPRWLDFLNMTPQELKGVRSEISAAGLEISSINISRCIVVRVPEALQHRSWLEKGVSIAEALGTDLITISLSMPTLPTPQRPVVFGKDFTEEERKEAIEFISSLAKIAERAGVKLSIELHDDGLLDTAESLFQFVELIDAPNVGVNPDLGNICRGTGTVPDWEAALSLLAPRTNNWHVKNYKGSEASPVWDGVIDYTRAFPIMHDVGYTGWVGIESYFGDALDLQKKSLAYLKKLDAASKISAHMKG
jgi:sugar phosphate isomerase/epimerase